MDYTEYLEHVTTDNDRWDHIAYLYYGDAARIAPLAEANESLRLMPALPGGLIVRVPILDDDAADDGDMPPWRRNSV